MDIDFTIRSVSPPILEICYPLSNERVGVKLNNRNAKTFELLSNQQLRSLAPEDVVIVLHNLCGRLGRKDIFYLRKFEELRRQIAFR